MAKDNKAKKEYIRAQFDKARTDQLVSDPEMRQFERAGQETVDQSMGAQQLLLNRASMASTGGGQPGNSALTGQLAKSSEGLAQASKDARQQQSAANQVRAATLRDNRAAKALSDQERMILDERAKVQGALDNAFKVAEIGAGVAGSLV